MEYVFNLGGKMIFSATDYHFVHPSDNADLATSVHGAKVA